VAAKKTVKKTVKSEASPKKTAKKSEKQDAAEKPVKKQKAKTAAEKKEPVKTVKSVKPKKTEAKTAVKETAEKAIPETTKKKTAKKSVLAEAVETVKTEKAAVKKNPVSTANSNIEIKEIEVDELMIEAAKFYSPRISGAGAAKMKVTSDAMNEGELPERYFDNKIVLMARDPYWCYAYWDISPEIMDKAHSDAGSAGAMLTLRVYDITGINFNGSNALKTVDISVTGEANNWYVNVWEAGKKYIVDLGLKKHDGTFTLISRSNPVTTPKDTVSTVTDEEWMTVDEDFDEIFRMSGGGTKPASGSERFPISLEEHLSSFGVSSFGSASLQGAPESGQQQAKKKRGFWLVADTELILYGATERDAKVRVKGEPVRLEPDGSFSLRFHLPDGVMHLPVEGESADGVDKITLKFTVERQSK